MSFTLAPLPYAHDALEPHIDTTTMQIHHGKHHAGYTSNLNNAIAGTALEGKSIETILASVGSASGAVRNNGGGFFNHSLFWTVMAPNAGGNPTGELASAIICDSIIRLIPGVLGNETSALTDSHQDGLLAPSVYTRPSEYKGWKVPEVLLSGHSKKIEEWREEDALKRTELRRPDLLE